MADCKEIQKMIIPFHKAELSMDSEEMFISHIEACPDCREELEIHYIIEYGLDEDADDYDEDDDDELRQMIEQFDFKGLVDLKLNNSIKKIEKLKIYNKSMSLCVTFADVLVVAAIIYWAVMNFYK